VPVNSFFTKTFERTGSNDMGRYSIFVDVSVTVYLHESSSSLMHSVQIGF